MDLIKILFICIIYSLFSYFIWLLIKPRAKDEPKVMPIMVLEKKEIDLLIQRAEVYLAYEYRQESRLLIQDQLVVLKRYNDILTASIALLRN